MIPDARGYGGKVIWAGYLGSWVTEFCGLNSVDDKQLK